MKIYKFVCKVGFARPVFIVAMNEADAVAAFRAEHDNDLDHIAVITNESVYLSAGVVHHAMNVTTCNVRDEGKGLINHDDKSRVG